MTELYFGPFYEQVRLFVTGESIFRLECVYYSVYIFFSALFFLTIYSGFLNVSQGFYREPYRKKIDLFLISGVLLLFFLKSLTFYQDHLNPDEGMLLTASINMIYDPRPWVSADATTLGPASYLIVNLFAAVGKLFGGNGFITYFLCRVVLTFLVISTFIILYKVLLKNISVAMARIISFLYILFFATSLENMEINAYNTEYVYILCFIICIYYIFHIRKHQSQFALIIAGISAGIFSYIKLQTAPIMLSVIAWMFYSIYYSHMYSNTSKNHWFKSMALYSIAIILPTVLLVSYLSAYNGLGRAYFFYISNAADHISAIDTVFFRRFLELSHVFLRHRSSIQIILVILVSCYFCLWYNKSLSLDHVFAFITVFVAIFVLMRPLRGSPHYIIFVSMPAFIFLMLSLKAVEANPDTESWKKFKVFYPMLFGFLGVWIIISSPMEYLQHSLNMTRAGFVTRETETNKTLTNIILKNTHPADPILVWGWAMQFHVYTNRPSATAQSNIERILGHYSKENIDIFIRQIKKNKPKLIIDAVSPSSWMFYDENVLAISKHNAVWNAIKDDYTLEKVIPDRGGSIKVYAREPLRE